MTGIPPVDELTRCEFCGNLAALTCRTCGDSVCGKCGHRVTASDRKDTEPDEFQDDLFDQTEEEMPYL